MSNSQPIVGVGAVVIHHDRILLIQRRHEPAKGMWAIPGGKVHFGESLQQAAEREIKEETGLVVKAQKPIHVVEIKQTNTDHPYHYVVVDLLCEFQRGTLQADTDAIDAAWFDKTQVLELNLEPRAREFIQAWWLDGKPSLPVS